jgi:hypothetical protein
VSVRCKTWCRCSFSSSSKIEIFRGCGWKRRDKAENIGWNWKVVGWERRDVTESSGWKRKVVGWKRSDVNDNR